MQSKVELPSLMQFYSSSS